MSTQCKNLFNLIICSYQLEHFTQLYTKNKYGSIQKLFMVSSNNTVILVLPILLLIYQVYYKNDSLTNSFLSLDSLTIQIIISLI